jgi:hypothetical protein
MKLESNARFWAWNVAIAAFLAFCLWPSAKTVAQSFPQMVQPGCLVGTGASSCFTLSTTQKKVTTTAPNVYSEALLASTVRSGCTIQYVNSGSGTKGFVFFGSATPSDTSTSFVLTNGQAINCSVGSWGVIASKVIVASDATSDVFVVSNQ